VVHLQRKAHLKFLALPAQAHDARFFASNLRWEDLREIQTISRRPAVTTLLDGILRASESLVLCEENGWQTTPLALLGVSHSPRNVRAGVVWMVATPEIRKHRLAVMNSCRVIRDRWIARYPAGLHNFVDTRNLLHLRWLELLDFKFGEVVETSHAPFVFAQYTAADVK
jgi:hypothetical protein